MSKTIIKDLFLEAYRKNEIKQFLKGEKEYAVGTVTTSWSKSTLGL